MSRKIRSVYFNVYYIEVHRELQNTQIVTNVMGFIVGMERLTKEQF